MRARAFPVFTIALALGAAACDDASEFYGTTSRRGKDPGTIVINNAAEPEFVDPGKTADSASQAISAQLFEGLTIFDPRDLHPTAGLAVRWEKSKDNRLYRFHLRHEAKWSDGKPVTAGELEYAWKRVLKPSTASQAATQLYPIMNAEAFNTGRLKVLREGADLLASPANDAKKLGAIAKGAAVIVLGESPRVVSVQVTPLPAPRAAAKNVSVTRGKVDELSFDDGGAALKSTDAGWKGAEVLVISAGPRVLCNGDADRWFEIQRGSDRGYLPGCALGDSKDKRRFALVQRYSRLPTFTPREDVPKEPGEKDEAGFVPAELLAEDDSVLGVRARGDDVLEVELGDPTPYFLDLTSLPTLAPVRKDVVEPFERRGESELWTRPENIVTDGPYTISEWKFRYEIVLEQNPHYWNKDKIKTHKVVYPEVEDSRAGLSLYKAGDLDFSGDSASLPLDYLPYLQHKRDFVRFAFLSTYWYELNVKVKPLDDVRVRKALDLAIDKQALCDDVLQGGQLPATHYVPDFTGLGYSDAVKEDRAQGKDPFDGPETKFDPERARALLREAGYEVERDGDGWRAVNFPSLEVTYNTGEGHRKIAVTLQDMWKRHLGVSVRIHNEEWKVLLKNLRDGNFQIARGAWQADYNHPNTWLETFLSTNPQNRPHWVSEEFDDALHAAAGISDEKDSIRAYRAAEKLAVDAMPRIPLYFYTRSFLVKPWLKGWYGLVEGVHLAQFLWVGDNGAENKPAFEPEPLPPPGDYGAGAP